MHISGIIAEYNPLHSGHIYHIAETKKQTATDFIITVMSGDFVQRGLPAVIDKYNRTKTALLAGSDLVIELPSCYALSSAEGFAFGGVSLLHGLGCVQTLSFGSELGNLGAIEKTAHILSDESALYATTYKDHLKRGLNPPAARMQALEDCYSEIDVSFLAEQSNNLLALEYCKSLYQLDSKIQPFTIQRNGDSYHSQTRSSIHPSATHIRNCLQNALPLPDQEGLPEYVTNLLLEKKESQELLFLDDFSSILYYKLWSLSTAQYLEYQDMTEALANKISNKLIQFKSFTAFANLLWSKDLTYARVCRCLMYILLEIKKDTWNIKSPVPYARILGFKQESSMLLGHLKEHSNIPLISKLADAHKLLNADAYYLLEQDIKHSHIYNSIRATKSSTPFIHEMKKQIVIL
ncbi:MAG: nucleotidyltransferase family protein [Lachnospiraceae bacterium]